MIRKKHLHKTTFLKRRKDALLPGRLRTKLLLLILVTGTACMLLYRFLWLQKWGVWAFLLDNVPLSEQILPKPDTGIWDKMLEEAPKYRIPESEQDTEAVEAMEGFFSLADEYTAVYVYGSDDGTFRAGHIPAVMDHKGFSNFFSLGYKWTYGTGIQYREIVLQFQNGIANVDVSEYHSSVFMFPYFVFCLASCILLFFSVILFFVERKMREVVCLEQAILRMSSGDLDTPVPIAAGRDELGVLSQELDLLRVALHDNLLHEQEVHRSGQELIAALSHDLRTPLTILKGYLEIVRLNRNQDMHAEYVRRCIQKTEDIQEMTDRMFEYALVYDEAELDRQNVQLAEIPLAFFLENLQEHADFLNLVGFQTEVSVLGDGLAVGDPATATADSAIDTADTATAMAESAMITTDPAMVKRVFSNLFSNILKYADKKAAVVISVSVGSELTVLLKNGVKAEKDGMESTRIGLRSVRKIMEWMDGGLEVREEEGDFAVELRFPAVF